jgi:PKD repeat protein
MMRLNPLRLNFPTRHPRRSVRPFARQKLTLEPLEERSLLSTYSLWDPTTAPEFPVWPDDQSVEVGVRLSSDVSGTVAGVRFYKGEGAAGPHVGHLWSDSGELLASVTFTNETDSGWQEADFSTPVFVPANTPFVVSYHADLGQYAADSNYFASAGVDNGPLHAPAGANGVYAYGDGPSFPDQSRQSTNYWVDVVFNPMANAGPSRAANRGDPVTFAGSVTGGVGPFTYSWDFGDGTGATGTLTPTHVYENAGLYTATLTVADALGRQSSDRTSATVTAAVGGAFITTPYDRIPDFGYKPTVISVRSGNWSDPMIWSTGQLPGAGDVVDIMPNTTVIYDVNRDVELNTIAIEAGGSLKFRTDVDTAVRVSNFEVLPGGYLEVGTEANPVAANVTASIVFPDVPIDLSVDPAQYGNGLIGLGKVTMYGARRTDSFLQLATEPKAGAVALSLAAPALGWQVGDQLVLPDTRQLDWNQHGSNYVSQEEKLTIQGISADGLTLTLAAPLQFDHLGGHDAAGKLAFLPHVADLTRNVVVRSANARGNRGQVTFTYRADVDVRYVGFFGLGRTKIDEIDNTTFDDSGSVTHYGTNEADRNPVQFRNLFGPTSAQANGYQYTFVGNTVFCPLDPMPFIWGINVNNSHYGLIQDNVVDNWAGAGIVTETGAETGNLIDHNFVIDVTGTGERIDTTGVAGDGFWFRGPNNRVTNNVATDVNPGDQDVFSYGYDVMAYYLGNVTIPAYQGADPGVAGTTVNMNATPLLEFSGNTAYGASQNGMAVWWLGSGVDVSGTAGVIKGLQEWNVFGWGFFGYDTNGLTIDGMVAYGDTAHLAPDNLATGIWFADYSQTKLVIQNCDLQGFAEGLITPMYQVGEMDVVNCYFRNVIDVDVPMSGSVNGSAGVPAKSVVFRNDKFDALPDQPLDAILMDYSLMVITGAPTNLIAPIQVFVYNYNQVLGANYQVYFAQQRADYVLPQSTEDGVIGSPVAGLTNAQAWTEYGIAIAGEIAPDSATPMAGIDGLVMPM